MNCKFYTRFLAVIILVLVVGSCGTTHNIRKELHQSHRKTSFFKGFVLYNPISKKEIINHNGAKYFTPASNTKLVTFYTAYRTFKDSVQGLAYYKTGDSLVIKGLADPSLFYGFQTQQIIDFLRGQQDSIYLADSTIDETPYGSGWAWDDYQYYYMPEKSLFPIYGNIVSYAFKGDSVISIPEYFRKSITILDSVVVSRELAENKFYLQRNHQSKKGVPFVTSNQLTAKLLGDTIHKYIKVIPNSKYFDYKVINSLPFDSLYQKMLTVSDNFIAEQLMLMVGKKVSNLYSVDEAIKFSLANYLSDFPQKPRWVDGSGLSRYNLFTPNDMVFLLEKMYREIPRQQLFSYFPIGGKTGTLKNWYANDRPFVYAKSGSLSNNYNLSGYIITKKGTLLIFSYMNNHFRVPTAVVKKEIEKTLKKIYNTY